MIPLYSYLHAAHASTSLLEWVLHVIAASAIWHLIGRLVSEQPMVAVVVALTVLAVLLAQSRAKRAGS